MNRHQIRDLAFQTLFAMQNNDDIDPETFFDYLTEDNGAEAPAYYLQLVDGVKEHRDDVDKMISDHLQKKWSVGRLNKSDLIILRIALYEMKYVDDVPEKVAINEALELAKKFCDEKSRNFINGVLDSNL